MSLWKYPTNKDDVIDSRDVIERIEELTAQHDDLEEKITETCALHNKSVEHPEKYQEFKDTLKDAQDALDEWDLENDDELKSLEVLAVQGEDTTSEWRHGETLIRSTYWVEYVQDLLKDCGDLPQNIPHYIAIDWKKTADNISVDYTTIDFDGVDYYIRSC